MGLFPLLEVYKVPPKAQGRSSFPSLVLGFSWAVMARGTLLNEVGCPKCVSETGEINKRENNRRESEGGKRRRQIHEGMAAVMVDRELKPTGKTIFGVAHEDLRE